MGRSAGSSPRSRLLRMRPGSSSTRGKNARPRPPPPRRRARFAEAGGWGVPEQDPPEPDADQHDAAYRGPEQRRLGPAHHRHDGAGGASRHPIPDLLQIESEVFDVLVARAGILGERLAEDAIDSG